MPNTGRAPPTGSEFSMHRTLWIAVVALTLSACGFHLRGAMPLPDQLKSMSLDCPAVKERLFCQALERQLAANGIDTSAEQADYELKILNVATNRSTASIDERGVAREIQLNLAATFALTGAGNTVLIPETTVSARQSYQNDQTQVLGKGREEQQITRELSQQLALQILSRISAQAPRALEAQNDGELEPQVPSEEQVPVP